MGAALARRYLADCRTVDALEVTSEAVAIVQRKQIWMWAAEIASRPAPLRRSRPAHR